MDTPELGIFLLLMSLILRVVILVIKTNIQNLLNNN